MRDWRVQNYSVDDDDDDNWEQKSEIEMCECTMDLRERAHTTSKLLQSQDYIIMHCVLP